LGDLLEVKHGYAFEGRHFADTGSHVVVTPGNFHEGGGFKPKGAKEKWYTGPVPEAYVLAEGALIIAMTEQAEGLLGSSAVVPRGGKYLHNQRIGLVTEIDPTSTDRGFLYFLFNTKTVRQQIRASATGVKVRHTAPSRIAQVSVEVPEVGVQRRIASVLRSYDDLIANNQRRMTILEEMVCALFGQAIAGRGAMGGVVRRVPIDKVPQWRFVSDSVKPYEGTKTYFATADVDGPWFVGQGCEYAYEERPSRAQKQPRAYTAWFARMKDTSKTPWYGQHDADRAERSILSSGFAGFDSLDPDFFPFLVTTLGSEAFHKLKDMYCSGATQMSLTNEGLSRIEVPVPSEESIRAYCRMVGPMLEYSQVLRARIDVLGRARDLLLPRLLSGRVALDAMVPIG